MSGGASSASSIFSDSLQRRKYMFRVLKSRLVCISDNHNRASSHWCRMYISPFSGSAWVCCGKDSDSSEAFNIFLSFHDNDGLIYRRGKNCGQVVERQLQAAHLP